MKLDKKINQLCKEKGLSLSQLAKEAGVPTSTLHSWTAGRKSINPAQVKKVASILEVSIHQLMFGEPDPYEDKSELILKELFSGDVRVTLQKIVHKKK